MCCFTSQGSSGSSGDLCFSCGGGGVCFDVFLGTGFGKEGHQQLIRATFKGLDKDRTT